jgi:hypothetical protein
MTLNGQFNDAEKKELVRIAKHILSGELGVIEGSRQMNSASAGKDQWYDEPLIVFMSVSSQTDHLPIGDVRKQFTAEALVEKEKQLKDAEDFFRNSVFEACRKVVAEFSK